MLCNVLIFNVNYSKYGYWSESHTTDGSARQYQWMLLLEIRVMAGAMLFTYFLICIFNILILFVKMKNMKGFFGSVSLLH